MADGMADVDRIAEATARYEQAVFGGDASMLAAAERGLDAVDADVALARGRLRHARFLAADGAGVEDPDELALFQRAAELYRSLGDVGGEAEATFWIGCLYQVVRGDDRAAVPELERARDLAAEADEPATRALALRHLGIAAHRAGRLDQARELLTESSELRRRIGQLPGVAANLVGLAYIAAAEDRPARAGEILAEAHAIATEYGAHAILRQVDEARTFLANR